MEQLYILKFITITLNKNFKKALDMICDQSKQYDDLRKQTTPWKKKPNLKQKWRFESLIFYSCWGFLVCNSSDLIVIVLQQVSLNSNDQTASQAFRPTDQVLFLRSDYMIRMLEILRF